MFHLLQTFVQPWLPRKNSKDEIENFIQFYCEQESTWDCGIAVAIFAQRWSLVERCLNLKGYYDREVPLWSIDIVAILHKSGSFESIKLYTTFPGIGNHHSSIAFYQKHMEGDADRIKTLFEEAHAEKWPIYEVCR